MKSKTVKLEKKQKNIPTYKPYAPDKNPMFFEKKPYQGAAGKLYPIPFTDRLSNEKTDKTYEVLTMENEYIEVDLLPEIGGKINKGYDKVNDYNFIYHNNVIKPALIGLAGPWVSGGIEFNWPQHHRPTTFMPADYAIEENSDGSKTVWMGEIDPFNRTKGMAGVTVYPDRSFIEVKVKLYNRTPYPQPFMWWANTAVGINENYKLVLPSDVEHVMDHDRRAVISYPIAKGVFHTARAFDYGEGTDISMMKNIKVQTSIMVGAEESQMDFVSGYDFGKDAGMVHVADHSISTGKKLFTWGNDDFSSAWCSNLTDNDGPYAEIMSGVFTDNQPDFTWIMPYETKTFEQYWYPIKGIGAVKTASRDCAVSVEVKDNEAAVGVQVTGTFESCKVIFINAEEQREVELGTLTPAASKVFTIKFDKQISENYSILMMTKETVLSEYKAGKNMNKAAPQPRIPAKAPKAIETNEELYINGLHLIQYKHFAYNAEEYFQEGLSRDIGDIRCNSALGELYYQKGDFDKAIKYFRKAIERLTSRNGTPYTVEPMYNLALALKMVGQTEEAYHWFAKCMWHYSLRSPAYYAMAEIDACKGSTAKAIENLQYSLETNVRNNKAKCLLSLLEAASGQMEAAMERLTGLVEEDKLDLYAKYALYCLYNMSGKGNNEALYSEIQKLAGGHKEAFLDIAIDLANAGLIKIAIDLLNLSKSGGREYPMIDYYLAYYTNLTGQVCEAKAYVQKAEQGCSDYCFPSRLESIKVLNTAQDLYGDTPKAMYYLGNLLYDRKYYDKAVNCWEKSKQLDKGFATVYRNLAIAYFYRKNDAQAALEAMKTAYSLDPNDARILFELQQLNKVAGISPGDRLEFYHNNLSLSDLRDDTYLDRSILYTIMGNYDKALDLLKNRKFNIYEGGEGKLSKHHSWLHVLRGIKLSQEKNASEALEEYKCALTIPRSYGEGKSYYAQESHIYYLMGAAQERAGLYEQARISFQIAARDKGIISEIELFRGLALLKLGQAEEAQGVFQKLKDFGEILIKEKDVPAYFGVGTPVPAPFEKPERNKNINGLLYAAAGCLGMNQTDKYYQYIGELKKADKYNYEMVSLLTVIEYLK